eukprot:Hpha_TRINITY_DN12448_c0_g2::TRINITY_DN12448_c0_g2_i1::g.42906::m.42906
MAKERGNVVGLVAFLMALIVGGMLGATVRSRSGTRKQRLVDEWLRLSGGEDSSLNPGKRKPALPPATPPPASSPTPSEETPSPEEASSSEATPSPEAPPSRHRKDRRKKSKTKPDRSKPKAPPKPPKAPPKPPKAPPKPPKARTVVAIVAPTRSQKTWKSLNDASLFTKLIPSINRTILPQERELISVRLHLAIDKGDQFWEKNLSRLRELCASFVDVRAVFVKKDPLRPGRVPHNNGCLQAYNDGADFIARVNDDTEFASVGWMSMAISALGRSDPPFVGVVGPLDGVNTRILAHDFTHRTHMTIMKQNYYPVVFDNWYLDDWVTMVYRPGRLYRLVGWKVRHHTNSHGTRYGKHINSKLADAVKTEVAKGRLLIASYLNKGKHDGNAIRAAIHPLLLSQSFEIDSERNFHERGHAKRPYLPPPWVPGKRVDGSGFSQMPDSKSGKTKSDSSPKSDSSHKSDSSPK